MKSAPRQIDEYPKKLTGSFAILLACLFCLLPACAVTPTATAETLRFTFVADTSTTPLVDALVSAYLVDRPHVTIRLEHSVNAERALKALQAGQANLASVSYLPEAEKTAGALWYRPFARDSIVVITHFSNPVAGLTLLQLRSIFQGQTLFWNDLGGPPLDVIPVSREDGAGTRSSFEALVMGGRGVAPTAVVMPSNRAVVEYVSATPGAIAYASSAWLIPSVNLLAVEGVTPSPASIEDGRYLLVRPFHLAAHAEPDGALAAFVDWVLKGDGQEIIQRGYAPAP